MAKISVIVPVYGVEMYIEKCARSLFEQTFDDIEYIFVNDCTKDKSIDILKKILYEYPNRVSQTKILVHQVNSGLPISRQTGLKEATGEYIYHCDSDDWIDLSLLETLYSTAIRENADIVRCAFIKEYRDRQIVSAKIDDAVYSNNIELISKLLCGYDVASLCDKLIRRTLYDNVVYYPTQNMWEDGVVTTQLFFFSGKTIFADGAFYHYRVQEASIAHTMSYDAAFNRLLQAKINIGLIEDFLKKVGQLGIMEDSVECIKRRAKNHLLPYIGSMSVYKIWLRTYPEINIKIMFNKNLSFRGKILHLLVLLGWYSLYKNIIK